MSRKSQGLNRLGSDLGGKYATVVAEDGEEHVQAAQPDLTLWQAVRKYRRTMLHCMGMTSAILMYGFDMVIVGTTASMPSFQSVPTQFSILLFMSKRLTADPSRRQDFGQKYNGKWIIPSLWLSIWAFSSPGAAMLGAIFGGYFQDWFGRRASMVFGSVLTAVGVAIIFVSNLPEDIGTRRGVFTAGKAFQGVTIAIVMTTTQTYMSEVLPPVLRGPVLAFFPTFTLLGQLIGAAVIYACLGIEGDGYVVCFGVQWPFTLVPVVMAFLIPESPTYLVRKGSMAAALAAQRRLDEGTGADSQAAVAQLQKRIAEERAHGGAARATYLECFRGTNLRRTLIIMFSSLVPQIFGITILGKASYFIQLVGMDPDMSLMVLIIGIVAGFLANLTSVWLISRFERRVLSLSSLAALSVIWCSMGISGLWSGTATIWYVFSYCRTRTLSKEL
jgi:MFS family permease